MPNANLGPRKQRTRQHVIADLSVHHVEGFILEEGHTAQRFGSEYSYDLLMYTFDEEGYVEPGSVYFQLKAAESLQAVGSAFVFDVDITKSVRVRVPKRQAVNRLAVKKMRELKWTMQRPRLGVKSWEGPT